jgi:TolA-binding protein
MGYTDDHEHYDYVEKRDLQSVEYDVRQLRQQITQLEGALRELTIEVARQLVRIQELEGRVPDPLWAEKAEAANRVDWPA